MKKVFSDKLRKKHAHTSEKSAKKHSKKSMKDKEVDIKFTENKLSSFSEVDGGLSATGTPKTRRNFLSGKTVFSISPASSRKSTDNSSVATNSSPVKSNTLPKVNNVKETSFASTSFQKESSSQVENEIASPSSTTSFSDDLSSDVLADSAASLSLESSPRTSTLSLSTTSNQFHLSLTENALSDLKSSKKSVSPTTKSPPGVWSKHLKSLFPHKEKVHDQHNKKRRSSNFEMFRPSKNSKHHSVRSQSLCIGSLGEATEALEKIREDNEALALEVRGKDEELRLLNATMDQVNQTWEQKVQAVMKDLENAKRKNEQLRNMITKEAAAAQANANKPGLRVPVTDTGHGRLATVHESDHKQSTSDDSTKALTSHRTSRISPPTKRKGVREAPKRMGISLRPTAKTDDVKEKLFSAISSSKCLSQLCRDELRSIVDIMKCKRINKGERLMQEGNFGQALFILAEGDCKIYKKDQVSVSPNLSEGGRPVAQWEVFGDADVFYHTRRVWSCKCVRQGLVWYITREEFKSAVMQQDIRQRKKEIHNVLKGVKRFENLQMNQFRMLAAVSRVVQYANGDYIVRQGASSKCAYIIKEGEVTLTRLIDGTETRQKKLGVGELFGESGSSNYYKVNVVASGKEVVQCILIPLKHFDLVKENVTSAADEITANQITESLTERNLKKDGQESTSSGYTASASSGYGSDSSTSENKKKLHRKRYDANHVDSFMERLSKLKGTNKNDFEFIATIGSGAFGSVDLVSLKSDSTDVAAIKKLSKHEVVASEQQKNVFSEKTLQMNTSRDCPFIASLYSTFKDNKYVYFVMEFCPGGELFSLLTQAGSFKDTAARFYVGCVVEALHFLHSKHILFRDLKPENVVIDKHGYCKLTDFGFAKKVSVNSTLRTYTYCGTPEYMAPEVILYHAQTFSVDLWSLGIFIFELLDGKAPFRNKNRAALAESILRGIEPKLQVAKEANRISATASSLIKELCHVLPEDRLGSGKNGISDVANHSWFHRMDWEALRQRRLRAPWIPRLESSSDLRYFDTVAKPNSELNHSEEFSGWDENF